jgi:glycosyltransferase involved in cell wall biosynthesis
MRIAWTGPVGEGGGVPGMGRLILRELVAQGVEVDLYVMTHDWVTLPVEPAPGLRIIARRSSWAWGRWYSRTRLRALLSGQLARSLSSVSLSLRLLMEHRRNPYDAVYQLSQTELFLLGRLRRIAPPIVVHPCTHAAGELRWHRAEEAYALQSERRGVHMAMRAWLMLRSRLQSGAMEQADLILGLSRRFNELLSQDYDVPHDKLGVVYTPVDLDRFIPDDSKVVTTPRTLLFISRISARKGVEEIVQLSHRLADLDGSVRLVVVGGPTQWSDYRGHLDRLHPAVGEYVGHVPSADLPDLMRASTMLLVPSRYEPGSIATAEALACGLPVVLSDEIGNAEVAHGPHVRIHRAGDVDDLEAAVRSLLAAVEQDEPALRAAARANAERAFGVGVVVSQLIDLISSVTRGPERPPVPPRPVANGVTTDRRDALAR